MVLTDVHAIEATEMLQHAGFNNLYYPNIWIEDIMGAVNHIKLATGYEACNSASSDDKGKIEHVQKYLSDSKSLDVFNARMALIYERNFIDLERLREGHQYFPDEIISLQANEVFVDCGAYDGGTVIDFVSRAKDYGYIYSFEPDPLLYELTKATMASHKVERWDIYNLGAYSCEGELRFLSVGSGAGNLNESGNIKVGVASLDSLLFNKHDRPTFIKMDIEGAELEALNGAIKIIDRDHPKLAICVYHKHNDLWDIPYWIKTNFPDYKIYLRQHSNMNETVCYAV
jgi:FkbM family methyltransferase